MTKRSEKPRGGVYRRGGTSNLWIAYYDAAGRRRLISADTSDAGVAHKRYVALDKKARIESKLYGSVEGPLTLERYIEEWTAARKKRGVATVKDDKGRLAHVPQLQAMLLADIKRSDIKAAISSLMGVAPEKRLAPRTIRHVYGVLHVLFGDAVEQELIAVNPCTLKVKKHELPKKRDKDPLWRKTAKFTRQEVEMLISDVRIPEFRRVLYGLTCLSGPRINEITPRKWRDYDPETTPLGSLFVHSSWSKKHLVEKETKTGVTREVPVHPVLATLLARWKLGGWERYQGRAPTPEDFIIPGVRGGLLSSNQTWEWLQEDLAKLGLPPRRQHDSRRTFISLARGNGAQKDLLHWVTHGAESDIMDDYTTPEWDSLCEQVAKLRIRLLEGKLVVLPLAANGGTHS